MIFFIVKLFRYYILDFKKHKNVIHSDMVLSCYWFVCSFLDVTDVKKIHQEWFVEIDMICTTLSKYFAGDVIFLIASIKWSFKLQLIKSQQTEKYLC